ncbi:ABC transporter permease [Cellvibrio japonicus]|uniref:Efflux ABC transporter, permease protein n=1 Tax=Cellvibrio japonicus (strain Ueda107) TaxID=498211 RepID=B3PEA7_CELJU|nr:FtsX-like permease family protein [Cellvibrio japonicus]ACE83241.1 efflux ABC transporter, permease protein [Cellvibrio japonicus Ueda107]QEI12147.1 FtsX-like permease family protein [Cellvibrio japonicus]QEI15721.1 FtsX-like permease family protein [Cellvibrio japonicus]QEI19299.1 FtsX-like permease family protein [Cellvibrio japonicus]
MLALQLLRRNWRSGELKLLGLSLILAVAVLSGIAIFTDRMETTLVVQSNSVLGADYVVRGSQPHNPDWEAEAREQGVSYTQSVLFSSMVFAGDEMHLASVKAVDKAYPLRGQFEISQVPFAVDASDIQIAKSIPAPGEAWVDSRLLPLLHIQLGDKVAVGEYELRVTQVLIREPDNASPFSMMGARLVMNMADLPQTQVIQPGSRVDYQWLIASDSALELERFVSWLKPQLNKHQRLQDIDSAQGRLGRTLKTGKQFLLLAAVIAVLLAGVAIAIAARQFAERHTDQVALMKSLGASRTRVRSLYFGQLLLLAVIASLIGLVLGELLQRTVAASLQQTYQLRLAAASFYPYGLSFFSGLICLVCFALPALWFLPGVPPLKILRRELAVNLPQLWLQGLIALLAVILLVVLFSRDMQLALSITGALLGVVATALLAAWGLLSVSRRWGLGLGGFWRLAFANLLRRRGQSLVLILVFAVAIMLLFTLTILRTSLIAEWRVQVPDDAPNHFLVNIPPEELPAIQSLLADRSVRPEPIYPMVRGRLTHINGEETTEEQRQISNTLRRELNLTWADKLADDNKVLQGHWWDQWQRGQGDLPGVSVEVKTAEEIGLKLGDHLRFSLGGLELDAQIASLRSLDWNSMRPNFFFIFEPGALEGYSPTYITSIYLPAQQKPVINELLRAHPTVLVIELDRIISQIRTIIDQVSDGVLLVLWLTLIGGCLVLLAAVMSSIESRKQEAGLLRALGSPRRLVLGSLVAEFAILGTIAGAIAILGSEILLLSLQKFVLETPIQPHYIYWLLSPLVGGVFVSLLGYLCCRPVVTTPPAVVLREAT